MTDEHFMRQWTDGHQRFSADLDRGLARLRHIIEEAYGDRNEGHSAAGPSGRTGQALLAGLGATALTVILLATTALLATQDLSLA